MAELIVSDDPLALVSSWETPWNCDLPGSDRVRLDNVPEDRKYDVGNDT